MFVSPRDEPSAEPGTVYPEIPQSIAWVDRKGTATEIDLPPRGYGAARVSPDGTRLLFTVFYDPTSALWVHDTQRGVTRRAYRRKDEGLAWGTWGPGDDEITFKHDFADGKPTVGWIQIGAPGDPRRPGAHDALVDGLSVNAAEWSPDRKHQICLIYGQARRRDIAAWSKTDGWTWITDTPEMSECYPTLSPDGKWLAYAIREAGTWDVYVRPFLRDGRVTKVTDGGAWSPAWSRDGTELFYRALMSPESTEPGFVAVSVQQSETGLVFGAPEPLFKGSPFGGSIPIRAWDVAPDGRFLMKIKSKQEDLQAAVEAFFPDRIRFIQNWTSRLAE